MAQLSWNDIFDFSSLDDPSSPPPYEPTLHDKCCDFTCCGLVLPDLHALVDHFEENHVLVSDPSGQPTSSPLVVSYPQPDPPTDTSTLFGFSSPYTSTIRTHGNLRPRADRFEHDFSDATSSDTASHSSGSTFPSPNPSEPICLPPSLFSVHPPLPPDVLPERAPLERARERPKDQPAAKPAPAPARTKVSKAKGQLLHPHVPAHLPPTETQQQRKRRSREREKAYKCPRPGCSKAYLNPNGLKYHLEKGTCTIVVQPDPCAEAPA